MRFTEAIAKLLHMEFRESSVCSKIRELIVNGEILHSPMYSDELADKLTDATLKKIGSSVIVTYMKPFVVAGVVKTQSVDNRRIWYGSWLEMDRQTLAYEFPFSNELIKQLGKEFDTDIRDLKLVWNRSGNCSAFLLRRIIEKTIYLSFARQGIIEKLRNASDTSKTLGLDKMIDMASKEKGKNGTPFLTPRSAKNLKGMKFLGDSAAHNFLADIDPKQISTEINSLIIALKELSSKLQKT